MGLLDDAIREHLELKRRHGASAEEVERQEREALGAARREEVPAQEPAEPAAGDAPEPADEVEPAEPEPPPPGGEAAAPGYDEDPWIEEERDEVPAEETLQREAPAEGEDVLEDTPEFLQDTPEHDRLWFEQRPPRDFDWDR
jgi:hypothetical protein